MSVQVRRRREAAAFLSSFVGAQGELLVDTTNNRVQVHDGATAGGWPAAAIGDLPGRNTLINGSFAVNQRGYTSGATLAANAYAHDRWKAGVGGCAYTFMQTTPDTVVTITAGSLLQVIDASNIYATTLWLTWTGTAQARVYQGAAGVYGTATQTWIGGLRVNALFVTDIAVGVSVIVEFSAGTVGLVQVESALPNAGPTRFERRALAVETILCQRYFQSSYTTGVAPGTLGAIPTFATFLTMSGAYQTIATTVFPVTMRAGPTITTYSPNSGATGMAYALNLNQDVPTSVPAATPYGLTIALAGTSAQYGVQVNFTANAEL